MDSSDPGPPPLAIGQVNALPATALEPLLRQCVAVARWARELAASRPFADRDALLRRADELSAGLTDAELRAALDDHPRIGRRPAPDSPTAARSAAEQSGVDGRDDGLAERLRAGNADYEERFGHIYLVCASGRSGAELLADLLDRLGNDPATEMTVVRRELGRIARLRLGGMVVA